MKKYISIERGVIAKNAANATNEPVILIEYDEARKLLCHEVEIKGPSRLVYKPNNPEGRINSAWIETDAEVLARAGDLASVPVWARII